MTQEAAQLRLCKQCEKPLLGRSDQKFCNDSCRNSFNKQKAKEEKLPPHPKQKAIFKILARNYQVLKGLSKNEGTFKEVRIAKNRLGKDFRPDFFTGSIIDRIGTWYVCFDRGWIDKGDFYLVSDFPEKAIIDG